MNQEEFEKRADTGRRLIDTLASLRLTVGLLVLSMILIVLGTLEQVHWGIWHVQKVYFGGWLCFYPMDPTAAVRIPLPAGFTLGTLLIVNLAFAHVRHFKATAAKAGNLVIHAGLLLLLGGGFVTAIYQEESAMIIPEGERRNYSEAFRDFEIALVEKSDGTDKVVAVPDTILRSVPAGQQPALIELPGTPFSLLIRAYHPNAMIRAKSQMPDGIEIEATQGIGARTELTYKPLPESYDDNRPNAPTAIVELKTKDKSLGTWVLNLNLTESFDAQTFTEAGKTYEVSLRRVRHYVPFTVRLDKFTHEKYPGTETPRRFASDVTLVEGASSFAFNISMNQPLRHAGLTFFQSSFGSTKEGKDQTVLQVVRNPGWLIPYVSVALMSLGLVWHFGLALLRFLRGRAAKAAALLTFGLLTVPAEAAEAGWNTLEFGEIPVQSGGRIVPIETLATGSLLQMRARTSVALSKVERVAFGRRPSVWTPEERAAIAKELPALDAGLQAMLEKRPVRLTGASVSARDWLIEVSFRAPVARHLPTFRVEHPN
ncbi:MAG: cytochrome c biogenesis protein ResB [Verrucomicrobiota bacterium]